MVSKYMHGDKPPRPPPDGWCNYKKGPVFDRLVADLGDIRRVNNGKIPPHGHHIKFYNGNHYLWKVEPRVFFSYYNKASEKSEIMYRNTKGGVGFDIDDDDSEDYEDPDSVEESVHTPGAKGRGDVPPLKSIIKQRTTYMKNDAELLSQKLDQLGISEPSLATASGAMANAYKPDGGCFNLLVVVGHLMMVGNSFRRC